MLKILKRETNLILFRTINMNGAGHIQAMMQSVKRNTRVKFSKFKRNKKLTRTVLPILRRPITSKKLTQKQKNAVRERMKKQRIKDTIIVYTKIGLFIIIMLSFWFF